MASLSTHAKNARGHAPGRPADMSAPPDVDQLASLAPIVPTPIAGLELLAGGAAAVLAVIALTGIQPLVLLALGLLGVSLGVLPHAITLIVRWRSYVRGVHAGDQGQLAIGAIAQLAGGVTGVVLASVALRTGQPAYIAVGLVVLATSFVLGAPSHALAHLTLAKTSAFGPQWRGELFILAFAVIAFVLSLTSVLVSLSVPAVSLAVVFTGATLAAAGLVRAAR